MQTTVLISVVGAVVLGLGLSGAAQTYSQPAKRTQSADKPMDKRTHQHGSKATVDGSVKLTAELVDPETKARQKTATVSVKVTGLRLIDPALVKEKPRKGQGHLHYQVDSGPVIATTATKLSFHELQPGSHKIVVILAANDHNPLGPQRTLEVTVPSTTTSKK